MLIEHTITNLDHAFISLLFVSVIIVYWGAKFIHSYLFFASYKFTITYSLRVPRSTDHTWMSLWQRCSEAIWIQASKCVGKSYFLRFWIRSKIEFIMRKIIRNTTNNIWFILLNRLRVREVWEFAIVEKNSLVCTTTGDIL